MQTNHNVPSIAATDQSSLSSQQQTNTQIPEMHAFDTIGNQQAALSSWLPPNMNVQQDNQGAYSQDPNFH